jgi:MoxR-like ATPase
MKQQQLFLTRVFQVYGKNIKELTRAQIWELVKSSNGELEYPTWLVHPLYKIGKKLYRIPVELYKESELSDKQGQVVQEAVHGGSQNLIPKKSASYVPFGFHEDATLIIRSRLWCPVFVTGLSGCGKTTIIQQVSAIEGRELMRINITAETDEDDLLGGMRLINGQTVFRYGPVVEALQRGALLLLDEIDYGSSKLACLQPVLEGRGVFIKKTGTWIDAQPGFNVFATANTKGKGDETGKFAGTNGMNEAFLDRFDLTIEHSYPPPEIETAILEEFLVKDLNRPLTEEMEGFIHVLVKWGDAQRAAYRNDSVGEVISTRRLLQAMKATAIYGDRKVAIKRILSRFSTEDQKHMMDSYQALDATLMSKEKREAAARAAAAAEAAKAKKSDPFGVKDTVKF